MIRVNKVEKSGCKIKRMQIPGSLGMKRSIFFLKKRASMFAYIKTKTAHIKEKANRKGFERGGREVIIICFLFLQ